MCSSRPGVRFNSSGHFALASCTRFSPNTLCPAAMMGSMASAAKVFDTATKVTVAGSRLASRQARSISCFTAARPVLVVCVLTVPSITRSALTQKAQDPARPGLVTIKSAGIASGRGPPPRLNILARSVEMDVLVDVVDPGQRNQMVLAACFRIALRELDVAGTFQMIHGSDVLA